MIVMINHTNEQMAPPPKLTARERRYLWSASAAFLLMLLLLFFTGLFFEFRPDNALMAGFYYVSEVIAACAAGIIASTITGFFKLEIEKQIGATGRITLQACGGFAVFLVVLYLGPRQKMQDLSSILFSHLISDCKLALTSTKISSQSRATCVELTHSFPSRAEVWKLLGRLDHMRDLHGSQSAVSNFEHAIDLLGLKDPATTDYGGRFSNLSKLDKIEISELLRLYAYARGNLLVSSRQSGKRSDADYDNELANIERIVQNAIAVTGAHADDDFVSDTHDILGKLYFYRHYQIGDDGKQWLRKAKDQFAQIVDLPNGCNLWPKYHYFLVSAILADENASDSCNSEIADLFKNFVLEIRRCATMTGLDPDFWSSSKFILTSMLSNDRDELYEITSKLGSRQFGGATVETFAHCNASAVNSMTQLLNRL
jgi:hypothetical protein